MSDRWAAVDRVLGRLAARRGSRPTESVKMPQPPSRGAAPVSEQGHVDHGGPPPMPTSTEDLPAFYAADDAHALTVRCRICLVLRGVQCTGPDRFGMSHLDRYAYADWHADWSTGSLPEQKRTRP